LGQRIDAYGSALKQLKLPRSGQGRDQDTLDVARLREADWILTTYETLTDHERSFARIAYPSFSLRPARNGYDIQIENCLASPDRVTQNFL